MIKNVFIILVVLCSSCATNKHVAEFESQPDWVKKKPSIEGYFVGIGSSKKVGVASQYEEQARRDALSNLAGEVSVNISSSSVLHIIETEYGYADAYDQRIEISSVDYLEGFEPVAEFEDETSFWTYYKVSKQTYFENKAKYKAKSVSMALLHYESGITSFNQRQPAQALSSFLKGLAAIRPYLSEETKAEFKGSTIDVGTQLYASLSEVVSSLSIKSEDTDLKVKRGDKLPIPIVYSIWSKNRRVSEVPVQFEYSGGYLKNNRDISDANGLVHINPGIITTMHDEVDIFAYIDLKNLANKATDDLFIRALLTNKVIPKANTNIVVISPGVALIIDEQSCLDIDCTKLRSYFTRNISDEGYLEVSRDSADYFFHLSFDFSEGESAGGLLSVYLNGELEVKNERGGSVWSKEFNGIKGVAKSLSAAKSEAFKDFSKTLNLLYFDEAIDRLKTTN